MSQFENLKMKYILKKILFVIFAFTLSISIFSCHNKYKGMCKADREKMKMVARFNKAQAKGSCPADKARIKKEEEEKKLSKKSQQKAAKQK